MTTITIQISEDGKTSRVIHVDKNGRTEICPIPGCGKRRKTIGRLDNGQQRFRGLCGHHIKTRKDIRMYIFNLSEMLSLMDRLSTGVENK